MHSCHVLPISAQGMLSVAVCFVMPWPKQVPNEEALDQLVLRMVTARAPKVPF